MITYLFKKVCSGAQHIFWWRKMKLSFHYVPLMKGKGAHIAFGVAPVSVGISVTIRVCTAFCLLANL